MNVNAGSLFAGGTNISLHAVRDQDFHQWAAWFNCSRVTRYLEQGLYPQSEPCQRAWFQREVERGRFLATVRCNRHDDLLGIVSLSDINHRSGSAQMSSVVPEHCDGARYAALEAKALLTEHALYSVGLHRLWSGQVWPGNSRWTVAQSVIGWFPEGFMFESQVKGRERRDAVRTVALPTIIEYLREIRGKSLWPGDEAVAHFFTNESEQIKDSIAQAYDAMVASQRALLKHVGRIRSMKPD